MLSPDQVRAELGTIRQWTSKPINVNLSRWSRIELDVTDDPEPLMSVSWAICSARISRTRQLLGPRLPPGKHL
jgi:hypothetical protein